MTSAQPEALAPLQPGVRTPADQYEELFTAVQAARVFDDSKTFVDCAPRSAPHSILAAYRSACNAPGFDLAAFVDVHFEVLRPHPSAYVSVPGQPMCAHIDALWPVLTRQPLDCPMHSSLLPLPNPYVVPGGRFGELYYWDSYFTMLGLAASERCALVRDMVGNFAHLIDAYGHVPNGTRTYYVGRSQPPLFAFMVELAGELGACDAAKLLPQLKAEHAWWMRGSEGLARGTAERRVVRLPGGELFNRYWDERAEPREEAWLEDVHTARASGRDAGEVYRHLRAAAESGWDFSTRWLAEQQGEGRTLESICTTDIVPVDLNAFLFKLETLIARLAAGAGDAATASDFAARSQQRRTAINTLLWDDAQGAYFDHDWRRGTRRTCLTAACVAPLFAGLAEPAQAEALAATVSRRLLAPGGLATTERTSDQQWDQPNGWAALQWMAICGFEDHGHHGLAEHIAHRWLATVAAVYEREGKLVEKYALRQQDEDSSAGGKGGEYPLQDGFGWTNGVTRKLLADYPRHSAHSCVARSNAPLHR